jgi:hypothetical protein
MRAFGMSRGQDWPAWTRAATQALLVACIGAGLGGFPQRALAVTAPQQIHRLLQVYAALLDYRPGRAPLVGEWGQFEVGIEALPMPSVDTRVGAKTEPVHPPPLVPRPRAQVGLGAGFTLGGLYVPPVPVSGYSAQLAGVELQYGLRWGDFTGGVRAFTIQGELDGPFTDPSASDVYTLENSGADLRLGYVLGEWTAYAGGGSGQSKTSLKILSDGSINRFDFSYGYLFGGVAWQRDHWRIMFEQEKTEDYLNHVVLTAMFAF